MGSFNETAGPPPLSVEHRLRVALATLDSLKRLSSIADEPHDAKLFEDVAEFARLVWQFACFAELHVQAAKTALPPECSTLNAPSARGGAR